MGPQVVRCSRCARVYVGAYQPSGDYGDCGEVQATGGLRCGGPLQRPFVGDTFGESLQAALQLGGYAAMAELLKTPEGCSWGWAYLSGGLDPLNTTHHPRNW